MLMGYVSVAQNEASKWYFGAYAGLNFMTSPPTALTNGTMATWEGCSSIADASGNLLFYTDGSNVYNSSHQVMSNGSGLLGDASTSQSAVIVKRPGSNNIYYIFTQDDQGGSSGFCVSTVDMLLSAGQGSVISKNVQLHTPSCEKQTSVKHCNGVDVWVITHDVGTAVFRNFLVTAAGVSMTPVTSTVGTVHSSSVGGSVGQLKCSPNGKKLGNTMIPSGYEVYDFDAATGFVSNALLLSNNLNAYGCDFSPDGTKFYGCGWASSYFMQWNLCAGTNSQVTASIYTLSISSGTAGLGSLQLAPDGKIYMARTNQPFLDVIHSPNLAGAACGYSAAGQSISPGTNQMGLPNFFTSWLKQPSPPFTHTLSCQTASFTSPLTPNVIMSSCSTNGYSLNSLQWNFGDPASGGANTSTLVSPVHSYGGLGTYTVSLILNYSCGGGTDTVRQVINVNQPCISVTSTSITCASLGSATVQSTGGIGPFSYTWMPSNQTSSVASGLSPGTYTIAVYDQAINFTYTTTTIFTSLIPLTGSVSTTSSVTCFAANNGTGAVTNLNGGSGNQFYSWTNGSVTFTNSSVQNLSAGIWTIVVTDALTGCTINQSFYVSQPNSATVNIAASAPSACVNSSITFSGSTIGGTAPYSYSWTGAPSGSNHTVTSSVAATNVYTLTSVDNNSCAASNTVSVDFIPNPTITVSDVTVCPANSGTLIAGGASTYTWNNSAVGNIFSDNPLTNTEYTVVGSALGCTALATASISLYSSPVAIFNSNSPVCNGQSLLLSGSGGSVFKWAGPLGFNSAISSPTLTPVNPGHSGVYHLTVTSVDGCTATTSSTLTVNPTPTLSATGATVCSSQTLNLVSNSEPGATYLWSGPLNFYSALQSPSLTSLTLNHSGNYTVVATSVSGCTNLAVVNSSVVPPPSLTGQLSSSSLCSQAFNGSPNSITLTAGGANTYSIVTVPDMSIGNPNGPISNLTAIPPNAGIGSATLSGSNGVCTVTMSLTFSIIPNPSVTVASTPVICAGDSYTYTSQGASSYTWSSAMPGFTTYNNGGVAVAHPSINSVFSVFGGSLGCFSASKTSTITVNPLPVISISPLQPTVCLYKSAQLTASGTATGYLWAGAPGLLNGTGPTVSVSPLSQQVYTVTGELDNCFASVMTTVNVRSLPEPTINTSKNAYCENENIVLSGEGGLIYEWRGPNNLYYQKQVISWQSPGGSGGMQLAGGVYSLTVTDANGCQSTATKLITIYESPQGSLLGYKESGCLPLCAEYKFTANGSNVSGNWSINNQVFAERFNYCFSEPGTFTISGILTDKTTGCGSHLDFPVTVYPKPEADFNYLPVRPVESLDEVKFKNTSTGKNQISWNWYFLNNSGYESSEENTSFLFTVPGEYPIAFVVSDENFCQDTVMKVIKVEPDFTLYIPDAFTPNGDELNDVFMPVVRSSYLYTLSVFDRWGQRIFYSTSPQSGWDGTFQGVECKMDVYTYKIILSTVAGEKKEFSGHVSLVR